MTLQKSSYEIQTISYKIFIEFISSYLFRPNTGCRNYYLITINRMTHKSFQLHFKTFQTRYKRFEIVIFSTGVLVRLNIYESTLVYRGYESEIRIIKFKMADEN